jgi:hypothetical protein
VDRGGGVRCETQKEARAPVDVRGVLVSNVPTAGDYPVTRDLSPGRKTATKET